MKADSFYTEKISATNALPIPTVVTTVLCHFLGVSVSLAASLFIYFLHHNLFFSSDLAFPQQKAFYYCTFFILTILSVWGFNAVPRALLRHLRKKKLFPSQYYKKCKRKINAHFQEILNAQEGNEKGVWLVEDPHDRKKTSGTTLWLVFFFSWWILFSAYSCYKIDGAVAATVAVPFLLLCLLAPLLAKSLHWTTPVVGWLCVIPALVTCNFNKDMAAPLAVLTLSIFFFQILLSWRSHKSENEPRYLVLKDDSSILVTPATETHPTEASSLSTDRYWSVKEELAGGYTVQISPTDEYTLYSPGEIDLLAEKGLVLTDWRKHLTLPSFFVNEGKSVALAVLAAIAPLLIFPYYKSLIPREVKECSAHNPLRRGYRTSQLEEMRAENLLRYPPSAEKTEALLKNNPWSAIGHALQAYYFVTDGKLEEAELEAERAKIFSGDKGLAAQVIKRLEKDALQIIFRKGELEIKHPDEPNLVADKLLKEFDGMKLKYIERLAIFPFIEKLRRKAIETKASKESKLTLIRHLTLIDEPTYSPFHPVFKGTAKKHYGESLQLLNSLKESMAPQDYKRLLARIHFKFERFTESIEALQGLNDVKDRLLLASAARYTGKSKTELLKLIGSIGYTSKAQNLEVTMLLALTLAHKGDLAGGRALLKKRGEIDRHTTYSKSDLQKKIVDALLCNQNAHKVIANLALPPSSIDSCIRKSTLSVPWQKSYRFREFSWPHWMSTADMEYLLFLVRYAERNLAIHSRENLTLSAPPKDDCFHRLSQLTWYPYASRAKELAKGIR